MAFLYNSSPFVLLIAKDWEEDDIETTTYQIKQIIQLFSFSKVKLELAKYAYDYTTDKNNYYKVADVLSFEYDKRELINYINNKK